MSTCNKVKGASEWRPNTPDRDAPENGMIRSGETRRKEKGTDEHHPAKQIQKDEQVPTFPETKTGKTGKVYEDGLCTKPPFSTKDQIE